MKLKFSVIIIINSVVIHSNGVIFNIVQVQNEAKQFEFETFGFEENIFNGCNEKLITSLLPNLAQ